MNLIKKVQNHIKKLNVSNYEIFYSKSNSKDIRINNNAIEETTENNESGVGVRICIGKKIGFAYTSKLNNLDILVDRAYKACKNSQEDPNFSDFTPKKQYSSVNNIYDKSTKDIELVKLIEDANKMIEVVGDSKLNATGGLISTSFNHVSLVNGNGIDVQKDETFSHAQIYTTYDGDNPTTGQDFSMSRSYKDIDVSKIANNATDITKRSKNPKKIQSDIMNVVLEPLALSEILGVCFIPSIVAESIQRNQSMFVGKLDKKIADDKFTIVDDATKDGGLFTSYFDGEGYPTQRTPILDNGILKSFLYDTYHANKENRESTGNSYRDSYSNLPIVTPSNFVIEGGSKNKDDLISEIKRGIIVNGVIGAHTANSVTGDFSVEVQNSFYIEDGEIKYPIKQAMLAGNFLQSLNNIIDISKDRKIVGHSLSPSILFENLNVVSM